MNLKEILQESVTNRPLVIVDVQPAYIRNISRYNLSGLIDIVNKHTGAILMYVNAENTTGCDDLYDIQMWWLENGLDEDKLNDIKWIDKGYGYLRGWMDTGVSEKTIIKAIREMYRQKINDSRELFDGDVSAINEYLEEEVPRDDAISVNWIGLAKLKSLSPFYLCGGGKNECLREVTLMCNAFNIPYKLMNDFVY